MGERFRPCALAPTYDNPLTVESVVARVLAHGLPVVLIDDGSGPEGRAACERASRSPGVTLHRLERNSGKGAAIRAGFKLAGELGFTHAFQIDADGQHDLARIPEFLAAAENAPDAVVLAYPRYDESAPRARLIGRKFTTFWVTLETGRRDAIQDAMVGFRVYPLAAVQRVRTYPDRMGCDIEVAVRLVRAGVRVINMPVEVRYPAREEGGVSHFRPVRDNLAFSVMHARLCIEGCLSALARGLRALRP